MAKVKARYHIKGKSGYDDYYFETVLSQIVDSPIKSLERNTTYAINAVCCLSTMSKGAFLICTMSGTTASTVPYGYNYASEGMIITDGSARFKVHYFERLASLDSPTFSGTPMSPTPDRGDDSTRIATTAYVMSAVSDVQAGVSNIKDMTGATDYSNGTHGLVPAPPAGWQSRFLRGDGTWAKPTNTTYSAGAGLSLTDTTFSNSGVRGVSVSDAMLTIDTGGNSKTWTIDNVENAINAINDESGNNIKKTYAPLQNPTFIGTPKAPTAVKGTNNTQLATTAFVATAVADVVVMTGSTPTQGGIKGLAPAPPRSDAVMFLRNDAQWAEPADMKGATTSVGGTHGFVPAPPKGNSIRYLCADGTWKEVDLDSAKTKLVVYS